MMTRKTSTAFAFVLLALCSNAMAIVVTGTVVMSPSGQYFDVRTASNQLIGIDGTISAIADADVVLGPASTPVGHSENYCVSEQGQLALCGTTLTVIYLTPGCKYCGEGRGVIFNQSGTQGGIDFWGPSCRTAPSGYEEEP